MSRWILGSPWRDAAWILFPGPLAIAALFLFAAPSRGLSLAFLIGFAFIDSGHVFTTAWRTFLRAEERRSSALYWAVPLGVAVSVGLWHGFGLPRLGSFVTYATVFHHIRQFYGMLRWYEKLNGRRRPASAWFLYALCAAPLALFHVKPGAFSALSPGDLFLAPMPRVYAAGLLVYAGLAAAWLAYEARLAASGAPEWNRVAAVGGPALVYGLGLLAPSPERLLFPMIVAHGIPYFAVMHQSLRRLDPAGYPSPLKAAAVLAATAIVLGGADSLVDQAFIGPMQGGATHLWNTLLVCLTLTPVLSHYALDAYIWRAGHRDGRTVYALRA